MKVLVATEKPFAAVAVDGIRSEIKVAGHTLELLEKYTDKQQLLAAVADADALIIRSDKVDAEVLAAAPKLKIVVRAGAGYDNVDLAAATANNVVVENTPGQNSNAVAELVFGLLIMAARNMYDGTSGWELKGKTLGVHGYGQIGRIVARLGKAFGMEVFGLNRRSHNEQMLSEGVTPLTDVKELYAKNQIVSLHIPSTPETRGTVGYEQLISMPKKGVLVNTARKEVIDEAGLAKALTERTDLKYISDVKPDNAEELLAIAPGRVFFTPKKMGAQTAEANINAGIAAARQIVAFFRDGDETFRVNK